MTTDIKTLNPPDRFAGWLILLGDRNLVGKPVWDDKDPKHEGDPIALAPVFEINVTAKPNPDGPGTSVNWVVLPILMLPSIQHFPVAPGTGVFVRIDELSEMERNIVRAAVGTAVDKFLGQPKVARTSNVVLAKPGDIGRFGK